MQCPRKYYYEHILNYRTKSEAVELTFGRHYHSALEVYDKALAEGKSFDQALDSMVEFTLNFAAWQSEDRIRNFHTLLRTVVWYADKWNNNDPAQTIILDDGRPAVELSFRYDSGVISPSGDPYLLCGHFDGLIDYQGMGLMVKERKTTKSVLDDRYFTQFSPNLQVSWYYAAAIVVLKLEPKNVLIDAAQIGVTFSDFGRAFSPRTQAQVKEFLKDTTHWLREAERCAEEEYWPMNEKSCFLCPFKSVCKRDPASREATLNADFVKVEWNPLDNR
jgi:hypothetical protein